MATFDFTGWGDSLLGKWVLETGESGVYRGQCTQVVTQILKDLGYPDYNVARGNGNQVGPTMVIRGEAVFVGTNISVPADEIHVVCKDVGNFGTPGHVYVAALGSIVYEQNITYPGSPLHNYGVGNVYPMRKGSLDESWRGTRYHYKITVPTDYDNVSGDGDPFEPDDGATGANQNRYIRSTIFGIRKFKSAQRNAIENRKRYNLVQRTFRGIPQG